LLIAVSPQKAEETLQLLQKQFEQAGLTIDPSTIMLDDAGNVVDYSVYKRDEDASLTPITHKDAEDTIKMQVGYAGNVVDALAFLLSTRFPSKVLDNKPEDINRNAHMKNLFE
jgi:hypothetical protein